MNKLNKSFLVIMQPLGSLYSYVTVQFSIFFFPEIWHDNWMNYREYKYRFGMGGVGGTIIIDLCY